MEEAGLYGIREILPEGALSPRGENIRLQAENAPEEHSDHRREPLFGEHTVQRRCSLPLGLAQGSLWKPYLLQHAAAHAFKRAGATLCGDLPGFAVRGEDVHQFHELFHLHPCRHCQQRDSEGMSFPSGGIILAACDVGKASLPFSVPMRTSCQSPTSFESIT